jgi:fatty-acyl-CoA synthase
LGLKKGDKVGVLMYNSVEILDLFYALAKIGGVFVPMNFRLVAKELQYIINNSECMVLVYGYEFHEVVDEIRESLNAQHFICCGDKENLCDHSYDNVFRSESGIFEPDVTWDVGLDDLQMIMYTSGTTGMPKGVMFTHSELMWSAATQVAQYGYTSDDVTLITGPLYHVGGLVDLSLGTTNAGGCNIIMPSLSLDIEQLVKTIEKEKVTNALLFPIMVIRMLDLSNLSEYDITSLRFSLVGGEKISPHLLTKFNETFPWTKIYQAYGLTEGSEFISILDSEYAISKAGSVGKAFFNVEIRIVDDDDNDLPQGEIGEIINRSPVTRGGYWKNPEATAETFANGWCHTGDLGRIDEDGFLWIEGRKKEMIRSAGENIYPAEVENVISNHPKVLEVAVYGVPDPVWTEAVMASVVLKEGCSMTTEEVIEYCKDNIASFKKPRFVEFLDSLPRTASNKVMKYILQQKHAKIAVG